MKGSRYILLWMDIIVVFLMQQTTIIEFYIGRDMKSVRYFLPLCVQLSAIIACEPVMNGLTPKTIKYN